MMRLWSQDNQACTHSVMNNDLPKGGVGDAGPSTGKPKNPHQQGGWVRGHQKDGGGYAKEMPKYITGKDIVLLFKFTLYFILYIETGR